MSGEVEEEAVGLMDAAANQLLEAGCGDGQNTFTLVSTRYYEYYHWLLKYHLQHVHVGFLAVIICLWQTS